MAEKEQKEDRYKLVRVLTNDAPVVIEDSKTGEQIDSLTALVKILNTLEGLKGLL